MIARILRQLPRKRGANGVLLIDMPGVEYPPEMIEGTPEARRKHAKIVKEVPKGYIDTTEAGRILGVTRSAARLIANTAKVQSKMLYVNGVRRLYWLASDIEKCRDTRPEEMKEIPTELVPIIEACRIMGVARSTVHKYISTGVLPPKNVLHRDTSRGTRQRTYVLREDVMRVKEEREQKAKH